MEAVDIYLGDITQKLTYGRQTLCTQMNFAKYFNNNKQQLLEYTHELSDPLLVCQRQQQRKQQK